MVFKIVYYGGDELKIECSGKDDPGLETFLRTFFDFATMKFIPMASGKGALSEKSEKLQHKINEHVEKAVKKNFSFWFPSKKDKDKDRRMKVWMSYRAFGRSDGGISIEWKDGGDGVTAQQLLNALIESLEANKFTVIKMKKISADDLVI